MHSKVLDEGSLLAPAPRQAGASNTVDLEIAGIGFTFRVPDSEAAARLRAHLTSNVVAQTRAHTLVVNVVYADGPFPRDGVAAPDLTLAGDLVLIESGAMSATLDRRAREAEVRTYSPSATPVSQLECVAENFLRMVTALELVERGGLLLHSSAAIRDGRGYVFFGPSAAGKSTAAAFSYQLGYAVLSDDQNVIRLDNGGVMLHGVPFRGAFCPVPTSPGVAPLARLCHLYQDPRNYLEPVPWSIGAAMLASQAVFVNSQLEMIGRVMDLCTEIVRRVPVEVLHLRRSPDFWQIL